MSDEKEKNEASEMFSEEEEISRSYEIDEEALTPWEKENLRYLQGQGSQPQWKNRFAETEAEEAPEPEAVDEPEDVYFEEAAAPVKEEKKNYDSFADRLPNIKDQRNKVLRRRLSLLVTIFMVPLLFFLYYVSPLSKLQKITVSGNQNVAAETIIQQSQLQIGEGIWEQFFERTADARQVTEHLPRVKNSKIEFSGITSFKITVEEYTELAVLFRESQYYPILENGTVLEEPTAGNDQGLPVLEGFSEQAVIQAAITAYDKLSTDIQGRINKIKYTPSENNKKLLTLEMADGNQVLVQYSNMDTQMQYYTQIANASDTPRLIDMEVGIFTSAITTEEEENTSEENETDPADETVDENQNENWDENQ